MLTTFRRLLHLKHWGFDAYVVFAPAWGLIACDIAAACWQDEENMQTAHKAILPGPESSLALGFPVDVVATILSTSASITSCAANLPRSLSTAAWAAALPWPDSSTHRGESGSHSCGHASNTQCTAWGLCARPQQQQQLDMMMCQGSERQRCAKANRMQHAVNPKEPQKLCGLPQHFKQMRSYIMLKTQGCIILLCAILSFCCPIQAILYDLLMA